MRIIYYVAEVGKINELPKDREFEDVDTSPARWPSNQIIIGFNHWFNNK